jgi:L-lactate dehydrogenase complex protein LldG
MSAAREKILDAVKHSLESGAADSRTPDQANARLRAPPRGPIPDRSRLSHDEQVTLFEAMATEQSATVVRVPASADVPGAIADYLKSGNLPPQIRMAPDAQLEALPWESQPLLEVTRGRAEASDPVSLTGAFAGIAETGTLMLTSGPEGPTTLNFLPDTHIVMLRAWQILGPYEDAWDRVRDTYGRGILPRTVNFISGPSRTADIEQTIQLGAHGPRRLHIVIVEDGAPEGAGDGR